jgi:flagellar basal-body rod protein FlgC
VFRSTGLDRSAASGFRDRLFSELRSVQVDGVIEDGQAPQRVFEPGHPDADSSGFVLYPNINPVDEMINMLGAARSYEMNLQVLKSVKSLSNSALELAKV